jgi:polysaccharide export outer membrane protein
MYRKCVQNTALLGGVIFITCALAVQAQGQEPSPSSSPQGSGQGQQTGAETNAPATDKSPTNQDATVTDPKNGDKKVSPPDSASYKIGEQDVLNITVWKEPQLSGPVVVRPDGKISVPLIDEVQAAGLTPMELQNLLLEKFRPFLAVPKVSVSIREVNSRKVYVIGQVGHAGTFHINNNTTVLQVLTDAGGLRDYANPKKIYVMRTVNGKPVKFPFHYDAVLKGQHYEENITLQPGDTIVVP